MPSRRFFIERFLRQVYNGYPSDDSNITPNLVNSYLNDALAAAAKQNYVENAKMDGISYVNNSFSTTFSDISITSDPTIDLGYQLTLPQIPVALGRNEGINSIRFKGPEGYVSQSVIWLSAAQAAYADNMRRIPNKICAYPEGNVVKFQSEIPLYDYKAVVSMVSGGDSSNLDSNLNIPDDWMPFISEYILNALSEERKQPKDLANDGEDTP